MQMILTYLSRIEIINNFVANFADPQFVRGWFYSLAFSMIVQFSFAAIRLLVRHYR